MAARFRLSRRPLLGKFQGRIDSTEFILCGYETEAANMTTLTNTRVLDDAGCWRGSNGDWRIASTGQPQVGHAEQDEDQAQGLLEGGPRESAAQTLAECQSGEGAGQRQADSDGRGR